MVLNLHLTGYGTNRKSNWMQIFLVYKLYSECHDHCHHSDSLIQLSVDQATIPRSRSHAGLVGHHK